MRQFMSNYQLSCMFAVLIIIWGLSWPIANLGLQYMAPLQYTQLSFAFATISTFIYLIAMRKWSLPSKHDWLYIVTVGVIQMAIVAWLANFAVTKIPTGTAALITYSTPIWISPISRFVFGERINVLGVAAIVVALGGVGMLLGSHVATSLNSSYIQGALAALLAAFLVGLVCFYSRYRNWTTSEIELLPWQFFVAALVTTCMRCLLIESQPLVINMAMIFSLFYNATLVTVVGYYLFIAVSTRIPVITTSMGILLIPIVGCFSAHYLTHNTLSHHEVYAAGVIILGLACYHLSHHSALTRLSLFSIRGFQHEGH